MSESTRQQKRSEFLATGVRFECQGSGKCCTSRGSYGYVYLSLSDRRRLAAHLGLRTGTFTRRHCEKTEGLFHLKGPERDCRFLEERRCQVYQARPMQCRAWPFWSENLDPEIWRREVAPFCAGVGQGAVHAPEIIEALARGSDTRDFD